ncbi:hypothetical protein [Methylobacterium soli]|uniref:Uncharacterized protein n=1 Tax=Methylobacterium soli TaxID=553447 RepID=A0A6L3SNI8_9HYPH|nr:hypothetical protein [Methylobacterium soli]KAB1069234.1 hypothetical protein F6X53_31125 [Methylobacterium soli]
MSAPTETRQTAPSASDEAIEAAIRLVTETEQRWSEQIDRIAQLREQTDSAALAEVPLAKQVLREIETTLGLARAYRAILQSLSEA